MMDLFLCYINFMAEVFHDKVEMKQGSTETLERQTDCERGKYMLILMMNI